MFHKQVSTHFWSCSVLLTPTDASQEVQFSTAKDVYLIFSILLPQSNSHAVKQGCNKVWLSWTGLFITKLYIIQGLHLLKSFGKCTEYIWLNFLACQPVIVKEWCSLGVGCQQCLCLHSQVYLTPPIIPRNPLASPPLYLHLESI
jgi:hypothetical protein